MIISLNWLKKFVSIDLPLDELTTLIGARLVEIEGVVDLAEKYKDTLIARIVHCQPIEGSDHLNATMIDDGGVCRNVDRDESGLISVVCGAPNVRPGQLVVWLPPGSVVPDTFRKPEPITLGARKLRGVVSNGMIASARELDLFNDHSGIVEVDVDTQPGSRFADIYELNDYVFDIENKSLTHRPDAFGIIGFAREVSAITGLAFASPEWFKNETPELPASTGLSEMITVSIDDSSLSERYAAVVLDDVDANRQLPLGLQTLLARVGVRPISGVVDVTNYLMMLTGQPLHAFDYDKLLKVSGDRTDIHVRAGRPGEKLRLLDGRTLELTGDDIVIAAGEVPVALAGAMGGAETEVDDSTKRVMLESATFDLFRLRATQMRHGIFSEAATRFTKGQPAGLAAPVLLQGVGMLRGMVGAKMISTVSEAYPGKHDSVVVSVGLDEINKVLGSHLDTEKVIGTLFNAEFQVMVLGDNVLQVKVPYWRGDIHIPEDIIDEVGRLNGFDTIDPVLPMRKARAIRPGIFDRMRRNLLDTLARAGASEVLTYSFVHGDILKRAGQSPDNSYRIINSLSPDLQYYRQSLIPSLLGLVHPNIKMGFDKLALFELNKVHLKSLGMTDEGVPEERASLGFVVADKKPGTGAAFYDAKQYLDFILNVLGIVADMRQDDNQTIPTPFEPKRSAWVVCRITNEVVGCIGEVSRTTSKNFKLPDYTAGFELNLDALYRAYVLIRPKYRAPSRFPGTERDICFQVGREVLYAQVLAPMTKALFETELEWNIQPVDIYQLENGDTKNITVRIKLTPHDRTLAGDEVTRILDKAAQDVAAVTRGRVI